MYLHAADAHILQHDVEEGLPFVSIQVVVKEYVEGRTGSDSISTHPGHVLRSGGVRGASPFSSACVSLAAALRFVPFFGGISQMLDRGSWDVEIALRQTRSGFVIQ